MPGDFASAPPGTVHSGAGNGLNTSSPEQDQTPDHPAPARRQSLGLRVALAASAVMLLILGLAAAVLVHDSERRFRDGLVEEADRIIDVLAALHVQSMLARTRTEDGDLIIDVLNNTFNDLARQARQLSVWLVMGPKVLAYQKARGQSEIEPPVDSIDDLALAERRTVSELRNEEFRLTRPLVLGQGLAADARCGICHAVLMGIEPGEPIGAISVAIDVAERRAAARADTERALGVVLGAGLVAILASVVLIRRHIGTPLTRLAETISGLAAGGTADSVPWLERPDEVGRIARAVGVLRLNEISRRTTEARLRVVLQAMEESPNLILTVAGDGNIVFANRALGVFLGREPDSLAGTDVFDLVPAGWVAVSREALLRRLARQAEAGRDFLFPDASGENRWLSLTLSRTRDDASDQDYFTLIGQDVTLSKQAEARIEYLAYHDSLTGLPNRALFAERLGNAVRQAQQGRHQLAVVSIDIDQFRDINSTFGHEIGNRLLKAVAERLSGTVRGADTLIPGATGIAHVGVGDFALVLNDVDGTSGARSVARRLRAAFDAPFELDALKLNASCSIGVALYPDHAADAESLMRCVSLALSRAKADPQVACAVYSPDIAKRIVDRKRMEQQLRQALPENQFHLVYQPQIDPRSNRVTGMEALLRWCHPARGEVAPGEFIPLAESSLLIVDIGAWVVDEVCRQLAEWRDLGLSLVPVAVNVSAAQVGSADLGHNLHRCLDQHAIPVELLHLEITESVFMQRCEQASAMMRELTESGVRFSLDDFGTGYSSLSYLTRFPIHKLKLDRAFITRVHADPQSEAIVKAVVRLGQNLGLRINAEGAEQLEQVQTLVALGVDEIQGYYFSRPLPADRVPAFLSARNPAPVATGSPIRAASD